MSSVCNYMESLTEKKTVLFEKKVTLKKNRLICLWEKCVGLRPTYREQLRVVGPWLRRRVEVHGQLHLGQVHAVVVRLQDLLELRETARVRIGGGERTTCLFPIR